MMRSQRHRSGGAFCVGRNKSAIEIADSVLADYLNT